MGMTDNMTRMMRTVLAAGFALLLAVQVQAQANPCAGDVVGKRAGSGTYNLPADCDVIILGYDKYMALEVASRQNDSLRDQTMRYVKVVNQNMQLRDSILQITREFNTQLDTAATKYRNLAVRNQKLAEDAVANAEFCERRLTIAKIKTSIFAVGGAIVGALVGILVGNSVN